jgi:hypothetical protein
MHELGNAGVSNFLEPHASWDCEFVSLHMEVDIWNTFILFLSAITSSQSVWHNPTFHSFAFDIFIHNWVEVFIWDHVQRSTSVSHDRSNVGLESFTVDFDIVEVKLPKLWVSNFVELKISLCKFVGVISSKGDFALTLGIDEH